MTEHVGIVAFGSGSVALDDAPLLFLQSPGFLLTSSFALGAELIVFCVRSVAFVVSPFAFAVELFVFCVRSAADVLASPFILEVEPSVLCVLSLDLDVEPSVFCVLSLDLDVEPPVFCALSSDLQATSFAVEDEPFVFCVRSAAMLASFFSLHGMHSLISSSTVLGFQGAAFIITRSTGFRQNGKGHTRVSPPLGILTVFLLLSIQ